MAELSGRCACGAVTWRAAGPVLWAGHCHCESCRRATSSPVTSFFGVPRATLDITGPLAQRESAGGAVLRQHCPNCGAQITYMNTRWPEEVHLYAATLDHPSEFAPTAHFHYAERVPWLTLTDDLPKYPGSADITEPL